MAQPLTCPQCGQDKVFRSRCSSLMERLQSLACISPFHCQSCSFRFPASRLGRKYPAPMIDRREHLRIPVRLFLSFSGGKVRGEGTVLDISMGGCIIESQAPVHVDDIFYLQIALENDQTPLEVAAYRRTLDATLFREMQMPVIAGQPVRGESTWLLSPCGVLRSPMSRGGLLQVG